MYRGAALADTGNLTGKVYAGHSLVIRPPFEIRKRYVIRIDGHHLDRHLEGAAYGELQIIRIELYIGKHNLVLNRHVHIEGHAVALGIYRGCSLANGRHESVLDSCYLGVIGEERARKVLADDPYNSQPTGSARLRTS